jgi:DNA-binding NarL/FixJ family response regulator
MRLSHRALDGFLRMLPELYVCRTVADFLRDAVLLLAPLIVSDGCGWFIYEFGEHAHVVTFSESDPCILPSLVPVLGQVAQRHPFIETWAKLGEPAVLMLTDLSQRVRDGHLDEHWDIYRVIGRQNLTIPVTLTATQAGAVSYRSYRRPFTEEDRALAKMLRPHLQRAYLNACVFSRLTDSRMATGDAMQIEPHTTNGIGDQLELTARESQVALWLAEGKTNHEIGLILGMGTRTVEKHVENILKKLRVENRTTAALRLARHSGLV